MCGRPSSTIRVDRVESFLDPFNFRSVRRCFTFIYLFLRYYYLFFSCFPFSLCISLYIIVSRRFLSTRFNRYTRAIINIRRRARSTAQSNNCICIKSIWDRFGMIIPAVFSFLSPLCVCVCVCVYILAFVYSVFSHSRVSYVSLCM